MHYKELTVWKKSMDLATLVYKYTHAFPSTEQFGLISQMRRAAVSIPSNIAEGSRRRGKETQRFLMISYGSGAELETQLEIAKRLKYGKDSVLSECSNLLNEVMKMLNKMVNN